MTRPGLTRRRDCATRVSPHLNPAVSMKNICDRRDFLRQSALWTTLALAGSSSLTRAFAAGPAPAGPVDLVVAEGDDAYANTVAAITALGGIRRFVPAGAKVGLLINAPPSWNKPGSFTHPEVTLAVVQLCVDAGVTDLTYIIDPAGDYWRRTPLAAAHQPAISRIKANGKKWTTIEIPGGKVLKKAVMNQALFDCDVFLNLPIAKHHGGTVFTGCLKNMMGACSRATNLYFHSGGGGKRDYEDIPFLSQCVADVNLVRKPALCVCDASEFLITNGPPGPGELKRARKVIAGRDPVAVDTCGVALHGRKPDEILMLGMARDLGLGETDLGKLTLKEIRV